MNEQAISSYIERVNDVIEFEFWKDELSANCKDMIITVPFSMREFQTTAELLDEEFEYRPEDYIVCMFDPEMQRMLKRYFNLHLCDAKMYKP